MLRGGAQDLTGLAKDYVWDTDPVWDTAWNVPSTYTEVLRDDLSIRLRNTKPEFLALFFERKQVIRFATEADIATYGRFTLPESLDPPYDQRYTPWVERHLPPRPLWFNVRLDHFVVRIIRPDGSWGEVGAFGTVDRQQVRTVRTMETAWTYVLDLQAINPGDVVEVRWKYMVPYDVNGNMTYGWRAFEWMDNWARLANWRVFFHGNLPVREQHVELKYHLRHGITLGGEPPHRRDAEGNALTASWVHRDLPGCMDEVNACPAQDLPHISVMLAPEDRRYWQRDRLSGLLIEQPHWMQVVRYREARALWWKRVAQKTVPDRQNKLLNEFVRNTTVGIPLEAVTARMEALHERIANDFTYANDELWYYDLDRGLLRMGDDVTERRIREIGRYDLYAKLINALGADYTTAYILDKRVGAMSDRWMTPLWDNDFLLGVRDDDGVLWMHPKRHDQGYMAGELPFYWQGSGALLMRLDLLLGDVPSPPLFMDLPADEPEANARVVATSLTMDEGRAGAAETRVFLSGQFSTLGRWAYEGLTIDPTIDPNYGDALNGTGTNPGESWNVVSRSNDAPFRFQAERTMTVPPAAINQLGDTTTVDLSTWVTHVVPEAFDGAERDLPFYWDFAQDDRAVVDIRFAQPVELLGTSMELSASTGHTHYTRMVTQVEPDLIRVESRLVVEDPREPVEHAMPLERLFELARWEGAALQVRLVGSGQ